MKRFKAPDGAIYSLNHLQPYSRTVEIRVGGVTYLVPLLFIFQDHCYTRELKHESDEPWLISERHGQRRVFCPDRWTFSHGLPALIEAMIPKGDCYRTTEKPRYFRVQRNNPRDYTDDAGWYIFFRFNKDRKKPGVVMSIESVHSRPNWPANARGRQVTRFGKALADFIKAREDLLRKLEQK